MPSYRILAFCTLLLIACGRDPSLESDRTLYSGRFEASWSGLTVDSIGGQHSVRWDSTWSGSFEMIQEDASYRRFTYMVPALPFQPKHTTLRTLNSGNTYRINFPSGFWEIRLTADSLYSLYEYRDSLQQAPEYHLEHLAFSGLIQN